MALITNHIALKDFNPPSKNLNAILKLPKRFESDKIVTRVGLACLEENAKSRLGWGHFVKKFLASTLSYAAVLTLPATLVTCALWHTINQIRNFSSIYEAKNLFYAGSGLGSLWIADAAIGRVCGVRPVTMILIATYDAYRQGARFLSQQVSEIYTNREKETGTLIEQNQKILREELKEVYSNMASELVNRYRQKTLTSEIEVLETNLPIIEKEFGKIGLGKAAIAEILAPLKQTADLIKGERAAPEEG